MSYRVTSLWQWCHTCTWSTAFDTDVVPGHQPLHNIDFDLPVRISLPNLFWAQLFNQVSEQARVRQVTPIPTLTGPPTLKTVMAGTYDIWRILELGYHEQRKCKLSKISMNFKIVVLSSVDILILWQRGNKEKLIKHTHEICLQLFYIVGRAILIIWYFIIIIILYKKGKHVISGSQLANGVRWPFKILTVVNSVIQLFAQTNEEVKCLFFKAAIDFWT